MNFALRLGTGEQIGSQAGLFELLVGPRVALQVPHLEFSAGVRTIFLFPLHQHLAAAILGQS